MRRALAVVGVHAIHTDSTILTAVTWTVVNVVLTVLTCEAWPTKEAEMVETVFALVTVKTLLALAMTRHLARNR